MHSYTCFVRLALHSTTLTRFVPELSELEASPGQLELIQQQNFGLLQAQNAALQQQLAEQSQQLAELTMLVNRTL